MAIAGTMNIAPRKFRLSKALDHKLLRLSGTATGSAITAMSDSPRRKVAASGKPDAA
jgi:hypothetical protein